VNCGLINEKGRALFAKLLGFLKDSKLFSYRKSCEPSPRLMDHGARPVHHELMAGRRTLWCEEPHRDVARRESRVKGSPPVATNDGVEDEMGWR
jgi:hypothetical protein